MLCNGVCGHERARTYFARAIGRDRLSHAYLLVGPEGVGKRRFAEELAAALLCRQPVDGGACGECVSCRLAARGEHPSFTLLEVAPGRSIEIQSIRDTTAGLAIRQGERRVLLLDDADRMTDAASNALLKTLEEPPPRIVFLLVTSRPAHLLATIHSRCHRVPFGPLAEAEFEAAMRKQDASVGEFPGLYHACGGSPGAALRLLEGIDACGGVERFRDLLAGSGADRPESLLDYLPERGQERKRDRVRRLLELILQGMWARRGDDPEERRWLADRAVRIGDLLRSLEGHQNQDLILEAAAELLRV